MNPFANQRLSVILGSLLVLASLNTTQAEAEKAVPDTACHKALGCCPPPNPAITWLDKLEAAGRKIRSYQAKVVYDKEQGLLGDRVIRMGTVTYLAASPAAPTKPATPACFAVRFDNMVVGTALRKRPRQYIFDGTWLVERHEKQKVFIKRQIVAPGETYDPLKLGSGPFPLPLGQKRAEVLRLFNVAMIDAAKDDPANTIHLKLTPRLNPATGKPTSTFTRINLYYNRTTLMPVKVMTVDESENRTTVKLSDTQVNKLDAKGAAVLFDTTTPPTGADWKVEIVPWEKPSAKPRASKQMKDTKAE